jgi:uncharacterized damage-inducible protein DinB
VARPGARRIWEIVLHIVAWVEIARARVKGESTGDPAPEQDWPPVTSTDGAAWSRALERLVACHREIAADVGGLDDARLDGTVANLDYSVGVLLHGIVEHGTYHGGQIALLKKA